MAVAFFRIKLLEEITVKLLNFLASIVGNYGIAIILTTIIVKLLLFPLTIKQEKSMIRMKELQPKIDEISRKYEGDKMKINEETAKLYKEEKVNPFSSCLPLLIQLPIFVALYYAFMGNAIPGDARFLWFSLKEQDALFTISNFKFNLLPVISAVLMLAQQKLMTPQSTDGNQSLNTMMYTMPVLMMFLFYKFPAGVNLYYVVNSIITIFLQAYIIKKVRTNNE